MELPPVSVGATRAASMPAPQQYRIYGLGSPIEGGCLSELRCPMMGKYPWRGCVAGPMFYAVLPDRRKERPGVTGYRGCSRLTLY